MVCKGDVIHLIYFPLFFFVCVCVWVKTLKKNFADLQKSLDELTKLSVTTVIKKMLDYAARPLSEFNKYEAIDILETLQNTSRDNQDEKREFYRLVYHTARGKVDLPKEHFRALVLRLLGDKDHTKVYEAVAKVEKAMGSGSPWSVSSHRGRGSNIPYRGRGMRSSAPVQCYFCGKFGHIMARCYARRDGQQLPPATRGRTRDNKQ